MVGTLAKGSALLRSGGDSPEKRNLPSSCQIHVCRAGDRRSLALGDGTRIAARDFLPVPAGRPLLRRPLLRRFSAGAALRAHVRDEATRANAVDSALRRCVMLNRSAAATSHAFSVWFSHSRLHRYLLISPLCLIVHAVCRCDSLITLLSRYMPK